MSVAAAHPAAAQTPSEAQRAEIRVGIDEGDFRGADNRALQAAVNYVASLGGGTVRIGPGRYLMRNALILRDRVSLAGVPGETVLVACDGAKSPLACDGNCNERQITLADPSGFRVGDGVAVADEANGGGFAVTTATLTEQLDASTFRISAPLYLDYMVAKSAAARRAGDAHLAAQDGADRLEEAGRGGGLADEAAGAAAERGEEVLRTQAGEDDHLRRRGGLEEARQGVEPVSPAEAQVEERQVGLQDARLLDGACARIGLADDFQFLLDIEDAAQPLQSVDYELV